MTNDIVVRVEDLGKRYRIGRRQPYATLRESLVAAASAPFRRIADALRSRRMQEGTSDATIWALRSVSFDVRRGEVLGVIGRNGVGKSTLLKILSRVTEPTEGYAEIQGRVGSLLEVGTGFHPELTGRENLYLNGAILGMRRAEIARKFDEIVAFAEVEKFVDTPVKHYSTGMYLRLAFSVAAHLESDILLIDEVLAVGDAGFQRKCLGKMGTAAREGRTVLFVSHQLDMVRALCDRCVLLAGGLLVCHGAVDAVIERYLSDTHWQPRGVLFRVEPDPALAIQVLQGAVMGADGGERDRFDLFEPLTLSLAYVVHRRVEGAIVYFELRRNGSILFQSFDTDMDPDRLAARAVGHYRCQVQLPCPLLKPGRYTLSFGTGIANLHKIQHLEDVLAFDVELLSAPSTHASYSGRRPGVVAVPLAWRTETQDVGE